jgi:molybdate transport repressor ModE-like protein
LSGGQAWCASIKNMKIEIHPGLFLLDDEGKSHSLIKGMQLLCMFEKENNLQSASDALSISYRHAWNVLLEMEELLGGAVIERTRGRGSELTELGKRLVSAEKLIYARIGPLLDSMATEIEADVQSTISHGQTSLRVYASHDFAIEALNKRMYKKDIQLDLSYRGSLEALIAFSRDNCDLAGFHVPIGNLEQPVLRQFERYLLPQYQIISLATRRQGIMVAKGNPKNIWDINDLMRKDVQFVNRQQGAGTRMILDLLLAQEGKSGRDISGYEDIEMTHAAIAAYILCGRADAGLGVEAAARQFGLDFIPLLSERYFLAFKKELTHHAAFAPMMELLISKEFQMEVNQLPGYDAIDTGKVAMATEMFPTLFKE